MTNRESAEGEGEDGDAGEKFVKVKGDCSCKLVKLGVQITFINV